MFIFPTSSWLKSLSALSNNISASFFMVAVLAPKISLTFEQIVILILYLFFGIVFLVISIYLDHLIFNKT